MSSLAAEPTAISLTPLESSLFAYLLTVPSPPGSPWTLRVAGGWVRDKLLGLDSSDIDIALDTCTGVAFAERVVEHVERCPPKEEGGERNSKKPKTFATIQSNPSQSKHLEVRCEKSEEIVDESREAFTAYKRLYYNPLTISSATLAPMSFSLLLASHILRSLTDGHSQPHGPEPGLCQLEKRGVCGRQQDSGS